jgi:hypothetical protein
VSNRAINRPYCNVSNRAVNRTYCNLSKRAVNRTYCNVSNRAVNRTYSNVSNRTNDVDSKERNSEEERNKQVRRAEKLHPFVERVKDRNGNEEK